MVSWRIAIGDEIISPVSNIVVKNFEVAIHFYVISFLSQFKNMWVTVKLNNIDKNYWSGVFGIEKSRTLKYFHRNWNKLF